jgi:DNA-binding NtrC family response regulator
LLRVVETREVTRLGSLRPKTVDVRLIAATHRDLEEMVTRGQLRQDLYYRLAGVTLVVPPLRERVDEISRIAREFVARFSADAHRPAVPISSAAMQLLERYAWPGNVRELRNVIERAVVFCKGQAIAPEHLGAPFDRLAYPTAPSQPPPAPAFEPMLHSPSARMPAAPSFVPPPMPAVAVGQAGSTLAFGSAATLPDEMEALERQRILAALASCGGNQKQAAELLGISRRTLLRRLDEYAVPRPRK